MSDRWSIYLDIEGFGALWESEDRVIWSLGELMRAILRIGRRCYPDVPERLFAHQFGDGFIVVSDHHEKSLERCVTIAVAIMRHVAASGRFVRGAIGEGEMSDISGCYPKEVLGFLEDDHTICLEAGLMTITPVMGSALIRAVRTDKAAMFRKHGIAAVPHGFRSSFRDWAAEETDHRLSTMVLHRRNCMIHSALQML